MDWFPTFAAVAGDSDIKEKLLKGHQAGNTTFKVHLDGYNFLPHLTGKQQKGSRDEIFYFTDDGDLSALRFRDWKLIFLEQRVEQTMEIWANPFTPLRLPLVFNLRRDPYERAQITSNTYYDWLLDHLFLMVPAQEYVGKFLATFKDYPPRQKAASFSLDQVMEKLQTSGGSH
jgi:arylsulfatase